jgi:tyrosinase
MQDHLVHRRGVLAGGGALVLGAALSHVPAGLLRAQPQARKRKNIEAMSQTELETYELAIKTVQDRSSANPADPTGFVYWADLHNNAEVPHSGCDHNSEKFLPWHRRHLYDFEMVLRQTKPGVTDNLMIPYWDWTQRPKEGVKFPKAFERQGSPLFDKQRYSLTPPPWDEDDLRSMVKNPDWALLGGTPAGDDGQPGSVESGPHNTLHGNISRKMRSPSTAALDPIFWSFHAYVDLVWARWQRLFVPSGTAQSFADGNADIWYLDRSFKVSSTAKLSDFNYEYDYDYAPDGPPAGPIPLALPPAATVYAAARRTVGLRVASEAGRYVNLRPEGPITPAQSVVLRIGPVPAFADKAYLVHVYVHPADLDIGSVSAAGRRALLVREMAVWRSHHPTKVALLAPLTRAQVGKLNDGWVISVSSQIVLDAEDVQAMGSTPAAAYTLPPTASLLGQFRIEER